MNKLLLPKGSNVVDLQEAREAKALLKVDPTEPSGPDWLKGLQNGTMFLTRQKASQSFELVLFEVIAKTPKAARLLNETQGVRTKVWVDTSIFSRLMEHVETVGMNEGPSKEEEKQDGDSDRPE